MSLLGLVGRSLAAAHFAQATSRAAQDGLVLLALALAAYGFAFLAVSFAAVAAGAALGEALSWPVALAVVAGGLLAITLALVLAIGLRMRNGRAGPAHLPIDQIATQVYAVARSHPLLAGVAALAAGALAGSALRDRD